MPTTPAPKELTAFLEKVPLFRSLNQRHLTRLAQRMRKRTYSDGDVIVEQGHRGIGLFVLESGSVKVMRLHADGSTRHIDSLGAYDFFGELTLLDDAPRTASVVAEGDVTCYVLSKLDFLEELDAEPHMAVEMLKELVARFRRIVTTL